MEINEEEPIYSDEIRKTRVSSFEVEPVKIDWEPDSSTTNCRGCAIAFNLVTRRHHCRGCGKIFCAHCSQYFILPPPEYGFTTAQRLCLPCLKNLSNLDYSRTYEVFESEKKTRRTIVIPPGALGNRQNLVMTAEALAKHYRVITLDLPGLGSMRDQKLTPDSAVETLRQVIERECEDKKALLFGYSMGGYVVMRFMQRYPEMCVGVILGGCSTEYWEALDRALLVGMGLTYSVLSAEALQNLVLNTIGKSINRDRLDHLIRRSFFEYKSWDDCASIMYEPSQGYYVDCISGYNGKIMFLNGENDSFVRKAEKKFVAAARDGKLVIIPKTDHTMLLHQHSAPLAEQAVLEFAVTIPWDDNEY